MLFNKLLFKIVDILYIGYFQSIDILEDKFFIR